MRRGYAWRVPAGAEARIGVGSYDPRHHVKKPTVGLARRLGEDAVRYQGNWFPHRLRSAVEDGVLFVGDSAGHCFPLSGEGIRTAFYFGIAAGREIAAALAGEQDHDRALERYARFHERHRPMFRRALALQRLVPALPPRTLTLGLRALAHQSLVDRAFSWYLDQAHPRFAAAPDPPASAAIRTRPALTALGGATDAPPGAHRAPRGAPHRYAGGRLRTDLVLVDVQRAAVLGGAPARPATTSRATACGSSVWPRRAPPVAPTRAAP